jgi:hypothetical protein
VGVVTNAEWACKAADGKERGNDSCGEMHCKDCGRDSSVAVRVGKE